MTRAPHPDAAEGPGKISSIDLDESPPPEQTATAGGITSSSSFARSLLIWLVAVAVALSAPTWTARATAPPTIVLWAWHHARNLESLDPNRFEVALLARTLTVHSHGVAIDRRRSPLFLSSGARLTAVVRIERAPGLTAALAQPALDRTVSAVLDALSPEHAALQIDFDAPRSFRPFYRALLRRVRAGLPPDVRLSMTALGSWCTGDRWLTDLPVDEIVPMLFSMGRGGVVVQTALTNAVTLPEPRCRTSVGVSVHERLPRLPAARRLYLWGTGARPSASEILRFVAHPWATLPP